MCVALLIIHNQLNGGISCILTEDARKEVNNCKIFATRTHSFLKKSDE